MRAVVQRVTEASVTIDGRVTGEIGPGVVVLLGIREGDTEAEAKWLADKVAHLRIFPNAAGKFDRSLLDTGGSALVVSQFTLYGDARKGRRPDFTQAARPDVAAPLIARFIEYLQAAGVPTASGEFQAMMLLKIFNDGPVTIILEK